MKWIPYAKRLVKEGRVKQLSETLFEVEEHKVKIQVKQGRSLFLCDCQNSSRFCVESPFCVHKVAVIIYLSNHKSLKQLDALINLYKNWEKMKLPVSLNLMINDLENLRGIL